MLRSGNPALNPFQTGGTVQKPSQWTTLGGPAGTSSGGGSFAGGLGALTAARPGVMTLGGTIIASSILVALTMASAVTSYTLMNANPALQMPVGLGGLLVAAVCSIILWFSHKSAPIVAPIYAIFKGAAVGWFSLMVTSMMAQKLGAGAQGLPFQALALTIAVAGGMLVGYATRVIRPGRVFTAIIASATIGYALFALLAMVMALMGNDALSSLFSPTNSSMLSIGLSLLVVGLAALTLVLAFEQINMGIQTGQPRYMEWYAGWALLTELIWLYIEILRLLAKLRSK